jgi:DNA polymerase-1
MEEIKELLEKTNINYIQLVNHEADDLIASFINQSIKNDPDTTFNIFTRDKDLLQLLNKNVSILKYIDGKSALYTYENFWQEYNFGPNSFIDYLSLLGDNVDNIEGIKGIGPVSAKRLIQQFHAIENVYLKMDSLPENIRKLLENKEEIVYLNKQLISLEKNIVLPTDANKNYDFE